jgi:hypothetical protein
VVSSVRFGAGGLGFGAGAGADEEAWLWLEEAADCWCCRLASRFSRIWGRDARLVARAKRRSWSGSYAIGVGLGVCQRLAHRGLDKMLATLVTIRNEVWSGKRRWPHQATPRAHPPSSRVAVLGPRRARLSTCWSAGTGLASRPSVAATRRSRSLLPVSFIRPHRWCASEVFTHHVFSHSLHRFPHNRAISLAPFFFVLSTQPLQT